VRRSWLQSAVTSSLEGVASDCALVSHFSECAQVDTEDGDGNGEAAVTSTALDEQTTKQRWTQGRRALVSTRQRNDDDTVAERRGRRRMVSPVACCGCRVADAVRRHWVARRLQRARRRMLKENTLTARIGDERRGKRIRPPALLLTVDGPAPGAGEQAGRPHLLSQSLHPPNEHTGEHREQ